ncbi:unnamed protein product [Rhodiola kirilowii]
MRINSNLRVSIFTIIYKSDEPKRKSTRCSNLTLLAAPNLLEDQMAFTVKSSVLISLLVVAMIAATPPSAHAQLFPGLGGGAGGPGGILGNIFNLFRIQGTLFCSLNGTSSSTNASATPPFGNALVQMRCGTNVMSASLTDPSGLFSILMNPLQVIVSTLLNNCNLQVVTPLSTCNAQLPSVGGLFSPLQFNGSGLLGLLNVANFIPGGFSFLPPL